MQAVIRVNLPDHRNFVAEVLAGIPASLALATNEYPHQDDIETEIVLSGHISEVMWAVFSLGRLDFTFNRLEFTGAAVNAIATLTHVIPGEVPF
jgi:hypothetical protein